MVVSDHFILMTCYTNTGHKGFLKFCVPREHFIHINFVYMCVYYTHLLNWCAVSGDPIHKLHISFRSVTYELTFSLMIVCLTSWAVLTIINKTPIQFCARTCNNGRHTYRRLALTATPVNEDATTTTKYISLGPVTQLLADSPLNILVCTMTLLSALKIT